MCPSRGKVELELEKVPVDEYEPSDEASDKMEFSEDEVLALYKEKGLIYVIFEGTVYDIAEYKQSHPGGTKPLEEYYGKNIDESFEE